MAKRVKEASGAIEDVDLNKLIAENRPVICKNAAKDWKILSYKDSSLDAICAYLRDNHNDKPIVQFSTEAESQGRFFYNEDMTGFNFKSERIQFDSFLENISRLEGQKNAPAYYMGSTDISTYFPELLCENGLPKDNDVFREYSPFVSLWMGNRTVAATHYDFSNNLICNLYGRRKVTLFPPDQISNLYPGPIEPTPAGQVVSMVNLRKPDFETYPNFHLALAQSYEITLQAGDILFYPAMWWHEIEGLDDFNVMMNYWWNMAPPSMDSPMTTLLHAMSSLRGRSLQEKQAWRALFDYYIFDEPELATVHLPEKILGALGPLGDSDRRKLRSIILQRLNR